MLIGNDRLGASANFQVLPRTQQVAPGRRRYKILVLLEQAQQQGKKLPRCRLKIYAWRGVLESIEQLKVVMRLMKTPRQRQRRNQPAEQLGLCQQLRLRQRFK